MNSLFWGIILILFGIQLVAQTVLGINLPLVRFAFGALVIYWGITLLTGDWQLSTSYSYSCTNGHTQRWHRKHATYVYGKKTYNTVFGTNTIDLRDKTFEKQTKISVNTVFGTTHLTLNPDVPTKVVIHATFTSVVLPHDAKNTMKNNTYYNYGDNRPAQLVINTSTAFGTLVIQDGTK